MTNHASISRRLVGIALGVVATGAVVALAVPTATAYVDSAHARTESIAAAEAEVPFRAGLSMNSRMVDTGLGLSGDGDVYVWGRTDLAMNGGAADPGIFKQPQRIPLPEGTIKQVTGQIYNANALDASGNVWGWGTYASRDGSDAAKPNDNPQRIRIGTAWNGAGALLDKIVAISSTEYAGAGIRADGTMWHWGDPTGYGGNSGAGASQVAGLPNPAVAGNRPIYLKGAYTNFFVILENGDVYYWGGIGGSSLPSGAGNVGATATKLTQLNAWMKSNVAAGAPHIVAVDGGINMGAALLSDGRVISWGTDYSRTGRGYVTSPGVPAVVPTLSNIQSMQFGFTGVALMNDRGELWGYGASDDYGRFPQLPALVDQNVVQYASGQGFYLWQKTDGTFWGRGYDPVGSIGSPGGMITSNRQINLNLGVVAK